MDVAASDTGIGPDWTEFQEPDQFACDKITNGTFHMFKLSAYCAACAEASERGGLIFEAAKFAEQLRQSAGVKARSKQACDGFSVAAHGHGQ